MYRIINRQPLVVRSVLTAGSSLVYLVSCASMPVDVEKVRIPYILEHGHISLRLAYQ